jgi:phosphotransacetylase
MELGAGLGGASPKDLVHAYMWFLIAGEQITQAKNHVNQSMTMEQLLEAKQRAAEWMRKTKKVAPRGSTILPTRRLPDSEEGARITVMLTQQDPDLLSTFQSSSRLL